MKDVISLQRKKIGVFTDKLYIVYKIQFNYVPQNHQASFVC